MKNLLLTLLLVTTVFSQAPVCNNLNSATNIDIDGVSKYGTNLKGLACNENTNIDFTFGSSAAGALALDPLNVAQQYITFSSSNGEGRLQFLDVDGKNRSYSLNGISLVPKAFARVAFDLSTYTTHQLSFKFKHENTAENQDTILIVYLVNQATPINMSLANTHNIIPYDHTSPNGVSALRNLAVKINSINNDPSNTNLRSIDQLSSAFLPFKTMDFAKFYTVQTGSGCKTNFLISAFVYEIDPSVALNTALSTTSTLSYNRATTTQSTTGNFLCYGSHTSGLFQTHMRESYPLWAAWFGALFFWVAILFSQPNTAISLYDRRFQDNKWTSWQIFSLFHLGHEEFFTRMMRTTSVYVCFGIQTVIIACLYGQLGTTFPQPITILWMGIIGAVGGFIFSFVLGFFLNGFYNWQLQKYNIKKKVKALQSKQSMEAQAYQGEIDKCQDRVYTYYYWYYVFSVCVLIVCWAISIHEMQKLPRQHYFQMWYWVGSICLAFIFNVFVLCPIMTVIFGNFDFFRFRGFWYNFELGQSFKQIQD